MGTDSKAPEELQSKNDYGIPTPVRPELDSDRRVFYVTAWGYAADHYFGWFAKTLNLHPEMFALLAHEGSRPKYFKDRTRADRPELVLYTEFLNDMGMTYECIGDCYSFRAGQMSDLLAKSAYAEVPVLNLLRHPVSWLQFYVNWRSGNMRMREGSIDPLAWEWKTTRHRRFQVLGLMPYEKEQVDVWSSYQGMIQMNGILGDIPAVKAHRRIEEIVESPDALNEVVAYISKNKCAFDEDLITSAYDMLPHLFRGETTVQADPQILAESWPGWKVDAFRKLLSPEALSAYKSFGYEFYDLEQPSHIVVPDKVGEITPLPVQRDLFVSTIMKSGTWLLREIIVELTGLAPYEPPILNDGRPAFDDEMQIEFPKNHFFIWHAEISDRSASLLGGVNAKIIFLARNIYDVLTSMFNHLVDDVDADIGRSVGGNGYLDEREPEEIFTLIISGFTSPRMSWDGLRPHIKQLVTMLRYAAQNDVVFLRYEDMVERKHEHIARLARYLNVPDSAENIDRVFRETSVEAMRKKANKRKVGTAHFTKPKKRDVRQKITNYHIDMVNYIIWSECPEYETLLKQLGLRGLFSPKPR